VLFLVLFLDTARWVREMDFSQTHGCEGRGSAETDIDRLTLTSRNIAKVSVSTVSSGLKPFSRLKA
jgi:hypothetical protein